jgi:hypothetical protein
MANSHDPLREVSDDELLAVLATVLDHGEPVPEDAVLSAQSALTWLTIDAELAELLYDSAADPEPVLVRDATNARLLAFAGEELSVDIEVQDDGLLGALAPPGRFAVEVQQPSGGTMVESNESGVFRAGGLRAGPTRVVVRRLAGETVVVTPWVML